MRAAQTVACFLFPSDPLGATQGGAEHTDDAIFGRLVRHPEPFPNPSGAAGHNAQPGFLLVPEPELPHPEQPLPPGPVQGIVELRR